MRKILAFAAASLLSSVALAGIETGGPDKHGEVACDLPVSLRTKNVGGRDGAGLCVFTSIGHAARFGNVDALKDFQTYMRKFPGGGYPEKVDKMIAQKCKAEGIPVPRYLQYEGTDPSIIRKAIESGRMVSVTYDGRDTVHYRQHIEHMVNVVAFTDEYVCLLDNNFIGENELVWLTPADFTDRWIGGRGRQGWAFILLDPGCPPTPPAQK